MTQRQLNQWVARLRDRAGTGADGRDRILAACHRAMREHRGLAPVPSSCDDFRLNGEWDAAQTLLAEDDALGRIYQALNAPALESAYRATARERRKFTAEEVPIVTQLFTPRWVVEFLLQNTLGRLWREWHPDSRITFQWLIDRPAEAREESRPLSTLHLLDPACGTMNFGLVAVEMLQSMYREEIDRAGRAGWPTEPSVREAAKIPHAILSLNLIGMDIDPLALKLAHASLAMRFGLNEEVSSQLLRCDSLFDSPVANVDVVVTNPPYLSARNLEPSRVAKLKRRFPHAWRDEYACFIQRSLELSRPGGRVGLLTMHSFMFTGGFERLRKKMSAAAAIETIAHFGGALFDVGNPGTLQTVAFTARKGTSVETPAIAMRLVDGDAEAKEMQLRNAIQDSSQQFRLTQAELCALPRGAWAYWICAAGRSAWRTMPTLGQIAPPRQGLATTDNARFVRYWWEVDGQSTEKWRPYAKGGQSRRWYQTPMHRVNWEHDGAAIKHSIRERYPYLNGKWEWVAKNSEFYGREGITYSYLTSGRFSARWMPAGSLFDVAGSALFPDDPLTILGVLNSSAARRLLHAINPTVNFQVGDLAQLPIPNVCDDHLKACVRAAMGAQKSLDAFDETSADFIQPMPWHEAESLHRSLHDALRRAECDIEQIVAQWYGMEPEAPPVAESFDPADLARRWVSVVVNNLVRDAGSIEISSTSVQRLREMLVGRCGPESASEIEKQLGGLHAFLSTRFAAWHAQLYKRRPIVLGLRSGSSIHLVCHGRATAEVLDGIVELPRGWQRFIDDGIAINFAPLYQFFADAQLRRYLKSINDDLAGGKYGWSETARALAEH